MVIIKAIWKNLEKKGELFMLQFLQTGKALYVLIAVCAIGILSKLITRSLYKRLIKETDNMAMTKNRNMKTLKQKLENAYRLNPVSYTHLDVYKRQCQGSSCADDNALR